MSTGHQDGNVRVGRPNLQPILEDPLQFAFTRFEHLSFERDTIQLEGVFYTRFRRGSLAVLSHPRVASQGVTGIVFYYVGDAPPPIVRKLIEDRPAWFSAVFVDCRRTELLCALNKWRETTIRRRLEQQGVIGVEELSLCEALLMLEHFMTMAA